MRRAGLTMIRGYQRFISPLLPNACRYQPTCSQYAYEAVERYGFLRGTGLAARRLLHCTPLHRGGYDPVPERAGVEGLTNVAVSRETPLQSS